ncbi:hypothetical protein EVAR_33635_1, partial [Eumeta japonica]
PIAQSRASYSVAFGELEAPPAVYGAKFVERGSIVYLKPFVHIFEKAKSRIYTFYRIIRVTGRRGAEQLAAHNQCSLPTKLSKAIKRVLNRRVGHPRVRLMPRIKARAPLLFQTGERGHAWPSCDGSKPACIVSRPLVAHLRARHCACSLKRARLRRDANPSL